ncbi:hypothetical protein TRVL_05773 [Trypanosoma vivax]|nr:hypothetical protein TRVL_05773 [Trypanosoma vivax]
MRPYRPVESRRSPHCTRLRKTMGFTSLALAVASLVLTTLTFFIPVFETESEGKGTITLWLRRVKVGGDGGAANSTTEAGPVEGEEEESVLYRNHFQCDKGKRLIQVMEGFNIIAVMLNSVNLVLVIVYLAAFDFIKLPLILYFLFAVASSTTVLGLLLDWYMGSEWCEGQPCLSCEEDLQWNLSVGWKLLVASIATSLCGSVTTGLSS